MESLPQGISVKPTNFGGLYTQGGSEWGSSPVHGCAPGALSVALSILAKAFSRGFQASEENTAPLARLAPLEPR